MIKKFECKNCKTRFEADDTNIVVCPHCQSDNVEYATFHIPPKIVWGGFLVILVAIGIAIWCLSNHGEFDNPSESESAEVDTLDKGKAEAEENYINEGGTIAPSISIAEIKYDPEKDTYYCRFSISHPPKQKWKIIVSSYYEHKVIAESDNGIFENIPYSKDDGFYYVTLLDVENGNSLCDPRDFPNFEKRANIKKPWTIHDLEKNLNGDVSFVDTPYIANNHKVIVVNKPTGDMSETSSIGQVHSLLKQCSLTAKVIDVEYDDLNKISLVKISINYPPDWMQEDE